MPTSIEWDPKAREFLRKLPKEVSQRIFRKVDTGIRYDIEGYLETLVNIDGYKVRIGDYRLFVDYSRSSNTIIVRTIKHRKDAYKKF